VAEFPCDGRRIGGSIGGGWESLPLVVSEHWPNDQQHTVLAMNRRRDSTFDSPRSDPEIEHHLSAEDPDHSVIGAKLATK
jgi:hypothetical protein